MNNRFEVKSVHECSHYSRRLMPALLLFYVVRHLMSLLSFVVLNYVLYLCSLSKKTKYITSSSRMN